MITTDGDDALSQKRSAPGAAIAPYPPGTGRAESPYVKCKKRIPLMLVLAYLNHQKSLHSLMWLGVVLGP